MKRIILLVGLACLAVGGTSTAQDIYSLIQSGRLDEAREALKERGGQVDSDGNLLFFAALLEPNADSSGTLLKAAIDRGTDDAFAQEAYYRLAQVQSLSRRYDQVAELVVAYTVKYPRGVYLADMNRLRALALEQTNQSAQAIDITDQYLKKKLDRETAQETLLDKARLLANSGKPIGAATILNRLTTEADGETVPPALYMLAATNLRAGKAEEAGKYYALLFEEFPLAVGLASLENQISSAPPTPARGDQAEQITSTYYSVKVGVFASVDNARAQAAVFKGKASPIDIVAKTIQGKAYHVVYVGRYSDYESAAQLRTTLQQQTGEKYEVAAR
ncbi:hypothetical protein C3F09_11735 [candidate division GN15 bacterium]|uniref:SPOR domain-containing protein n=1 Tax=candidate division GN15 bacterium TaxID=2072418 RepID=A0A855WY03_9BACT|nr:MAG: hypothetical protein C3F09_11735 [candidate division GN15 bacterium]